MECTTENPADILISALKERNISVKRSEIESAFNDEASSAENAQWVSEHLSYDTLLTKEELALYSQLESSGTLQHILHDPGLASTRPLLDEDIQNAIGSLKASTEAIQKQTEILNTQCETLNKQLRLDDNCAIGQNRDMERLRKKHESGRQDVNAASNDLVHELEANLRAETEKARLDGKKILSSLTSRLKEDDRILAGLERLASGIKSTGNDASVAKRTEQLVAVLAEYVAEEIHYRLDRLYLESSQADQVGSKQAAGEHDEEALAALREELESLYPEVDVLAEMSTKQQFSEPVLRELQNRHGQLRNASQGKLECVLDTIMEMTYSTKSLTQRLRDRESYCQTLESVINTYRSEVGDPFSEKTISRRETMLRRRSMQPQSLFSSPGKQTAPLPESQALASLLRRVGLSSESVFKSEEEIGGANALHEKKSHMLEYFRTLGIGADLPLVTELIPTDRASRLLSSSLHADSYFETSLSNIEQDQSLTELEAQLGFVQKGVENLNLDALHQRGKNQNKFLERWAS
ncbi:uncharacterized protein ACHE_50305S [Aspergillus chevalieri]|uniref:Uncharacterized protein n=1 Tax=Aspergillus chevalieri TaxID=182096 RepID=A0A7R7VR06_ASPCH|nr:uncharacterized protein ACHE_50305S [Aspergillus chevalieri]BCR89107.1 hypothetical protein ACHE_50305S [Aspergillus chevalieri]